MSESMTSGADGVNALTEVKAVLIILLDAADSCDGAVLIDEIRLLEEITSIVSAVQGVRVVAFDAHQRAQHAAAGVPAERQGRGVAVQLGLARRMSPWAASRHLGQLRILTTELPATFAQLAAGRVPEWRALKVAQQTAWLSREHRAVVDAEIAPQLEHLGHRRTVDLTNKLAYRLDPHDYLAHVNSAEKNRPATTPNKPSASSNTSCPTAASKPPPPPDTPTSAQYPNHPERNALCQTGPVKPNSTPPERDSHGTRSAMSLSSASRRVIDDVR